MNFSWKLIELFIFVVGVQLACEVIFNGKVVCIAIGKFAVKTECKS